MDLTRLMSVCEQIKSLEIKAFQPPIKNKKTLTPSETTDTTVVINPKDVDNLRNFVQVWTDILDVDETYQRFRESEYTDLRLFEEDNHLVNVGFFYVKVNEQCSPLEFLGLLEKMPIEQFCNPGTHVIPYNIFSELFCQQEKPSASKSPVGADGQIIQLMILGDFFGYWYLINPYSQMRRTHSNTKLLLAGLGGFAVKISPNYINDCYELVKNFENSSFRQRHTNQTLLQ
jgi:hypothetical protein